MEIGEASNLKSHSRGSALFLVYAINKINKKVCTFSGLCPMRQRAVADIPESMLSDIRHHPPPRPPDGRLTRNKIKKPPLAVKKARLFAGTKRDYIIRPILMLGVY